MAALRSHRPTYSPACNLQSRQIVTEVASIAPLSARERPSWRSDEKAYART